MKTSKIKIRPYIPFLKDEKKFGREEFAILKYGNVEIELDYTIIKDLSLDCGWERVSSIVNASFKEICREMQFKINGELPLYHRDGGSKYVELISHNPLHPINKEIKINR